MDNNKKKKIAISMLALVFLMLVGLFAIVSAAQVEEVKKQLDIGNKYLSESKYEEAIIAFEKVLKIDKRNVDVRLELAEAYIATKKPKKAEDVLWEGIKFTPKESILYIRLASLYLDQGRVEEAVEVLDKGYSKIKDKGIKRILDEINGQMKISIEINPLQVNNKTEVMLERIDKEGKISIINSKWSTKGKKIGQLEESKDKKVVFTAKAPGKETIIAKVGSIEKTASMEVQESIVTSVEIVPKTSKATVGDSLEFEAIVIDQLGNEANVEITWQLTGDLGKLGSSQGKINKIDFIKDGTGQITASAGDIKSTAVIVVEKRKFAIVTVVSGEGSISRTPNSENYDDGTTVKLNVKPKEGWLFKGWQGDLVSTKNPIEVVMDSNKNLEAIFEIKQYKLTTEVSGNGVINRSKVADTYPHGSKVTLTAAAKQEWQFDHWEGASSSKKSEITLTMNDNKKVKAVFIPKEYPVNITYEGKGKVEKIKKESNKVQLIAKPEKGWNFDHWEKDLTGSTNPIEIEVKSEKNIKAVFTKPATEKKVTVNPGERVIAGYIDIPKSSNAKPLKVEAFFGTISGEQWPDLNIKSSKSEWFGYGCQYLHGRTDQIDTSNSSSSKAAYNGWGASDETMIFEEPASGRWYIEIRNDGGQAPSTFTVKSNYLIYPVANGE